MTNFEILIKELQQHMTPEDLADFRYAYIGFGCEVCKNKVVCQNRLDVLFELDDDCIERPPCRDMFVDWLKQEAQQ